MQTSLKWVNELVNIETINLDHLVNKLTLSGFEVERIFELNINHKKEIAFDISATANRSDSLSIQGISNEISILLDQPIKPTNYSIENLSWKSTIENLSEIIPEDKNYLTFIAMTVEKVTNFRVPKWLKNKLLSSGITPTNNLLDFQTYLLLETGYPFEFYDLDKIYSNLNTSKFQLTIEASRDEEQFLASNDINYVLNQSISIIKANKLSIGIAGIIPKKDFCYSEDTKSLLIEGSIFDSTTIRQQSRILGLRTDRSVRYEKSLKNINFLESLYKLVYLLRIANPNLICKLHTVKKCLRQSSKPIILQYKTIKEILGPITASSNNINYLTPDLIQSYLDRLKFQNIHDTSNLTWKVQIPYLRSDDIAREIDLVEEIGRLHGFNNFLPRLPKIYTIGDEDLSFQTRKKIASCFLNLGFNELIHYSLVKKRIFTNNKIELINPLNADYSHLRSTLLPNLLQSVQKNLKQGNESREGFEFGHVFSEKNLYDYEEKEKIAGIFGGFKTKSIWSDSVKPFSWFEAKGKLEQFFKQLNIQPEWEEYSKLEINEIFHPYRTAKLYLDNKIELGIFGQIHPILSNQLNSPPNLYLFELDFQVIKNQVRKNNFKFYKNYSSYPKIVKDLSFVIHKEISFKKIKKLLYLNGTEFLTNIDLLDEYKGDSIAENYISLCLQLTFQSKEETLQNKKIEKTIDNLQTLLINQLNATIRT